jgi:hypothetical protein
MTVLICLTAVQAAVVTATCLALLWEVHRSRKETKDRGERRLEYAADQRELSLLEEVELRKIRKALGGAEVEAHGRP